MSRIIPYNINLSTADNGLTADQIEIPDFFYNRMKTGVAAMDNLFGGSELPGLVKGTTFSISAAKGMGKTTGLLQILERFKQKKLLVAYYSSEQTIYQLAFTAKRIGANHVPLGSFNYIEDALAHAKKSTYDIVIFDSLQKFRTKQKVGKDQTTFINAMIRQYSQDNNVSSGIVLHRTKAGKTKGDSSIEHDVETTIEIIAADPELYPDDTRIWTTTKNRFGETLYIAMAMGQMGFNWVEPVSISQVLRVKTKENKTDARTERKNQLKEDIMEFIRQERTVSVQSLLKQFNSELNGDATKTRTLLKDLVMSGELVQTGRGMITNWTIKTK